MDDHGDDSCSARPRSILNRRAAVSRASAETPQKRDEEMRVKKHIEIVVPLVPVRELPGLAPDERVAELQLRLRTGMYSQEVVLEHVARALLASHHV